MCGRVGCGLGQVVARSGEDPPRTTRGRSERWANFTARRRDRMDPRRSPSYRASMTLRFVFALLAVATPVAAVEPDYTLDQLRKLLRRDLDETESRRLEADGKKAEALALAKKVVAVDRAIRGGDAPQLADALVRVAALASDLDLKAANEARKAAADIKAKTLGERHAEVVALRSRVALDAALVALPKADQRTLNDCVERVTKGFADLLAGRVADARKALAGADETVRKYLGGDHPYYGLVLYVCGLGDLFAGDAAAATAKLAKAIGLLEGIVRDGLADAATAEAMTNVFDQLASLAFGRGDFEAFAARHEDGLRVRTAFFGPKHPTVVEAGLDVRRAKIVAALPPEGRDAVKEFDRLFDEGREIRSKDAAGAAERFRDAAAIARLAFGPDSLPYANMVGEQAYAEDMAGDLDAASRHFWTAAGIAKTLLGRDHPNAKWIFDGLHRAGTAAAAKAEAKDDYALAVKLYATAADRRETLFGADDPRARRGATTAGSPRPWPGCRRPSGNSSATPARTTPTPARWRPGRRPLKWPSGPKGRFSNSSAPTRPSTPTPWSSRPPRGRERRLRGLRPPPRRRPGPAGEAVRHRPPRLRPGVAANRHRRPGQGGPRRAGEAVPRRRRHFDGVGRPGRLPHARRRHQPGRLPVVRREAGRGHQDVPRPAGRGQAGRRGQQLATPLRRPGAPRDVARGGRIRRSRRRSYRPARRDPGRGRREDGSGPRRPEFARLHGTGPRPAGRGRGPPRPGDENPYWESRRGSRSSITNGLSHRTSRSCGSNRADSTTAGHSSPPRSPAWKRSSPASRAAWRTDCRGSVRRFTPTAATTCSPTPVRKRWPKPATCSVGCSNSAARRTERIIRRPRRGGTNWASSPAWPETSRGPRRAS